MTDGLLHASTPGLVEALCDHQAMAIWETLRGAATGLSTSEIAAALNLPLAFVQPTLDRLIALQLVKQRPAGRGRRTATFCVKLPELHVSFEGIEPGPLAELFSRWHESRMQYFELLLKHRKQSEGVHPKDFCAVGWTRMTPEERAKLMMLIDQIGGLMRNTKRRKSPFQGGSGNQSHDSSSTDMRTYGLLVRVLDLASDPLPQPNIKFTRGGSVPATATDAKARNGLAPRERQVADALAAGLSRPEIAKQLGLSPNTVVTVSGRVYRKLGVRNRAELVRAMMR